jgi:hypothetical protein
MNSVAFAISLSVISVASASTIGPEHDFFRYNSEKATAYQNHLRSLSSEPDPKYCIDSSTVQYGLNNKASVMGTFIECISKVQDIMISPTYYTNEPVRVNSSITLNNLISIDELSGQVAVDLMLNLRWVDPRLDMPALWNVSDPWVYYFGVDITQASTVFNVQGIQPLIWIPDVNFPDATSMTKTQYYIKVYPYGEVRYLLHCVLVLSQPQFEYTDFPCDSQVIQIKYFSFTLNYEQLILYPPDFTDPITFTSVYGGNDQKFSLNPIWKLIGSYGEYTTLYLNNGFSPRAAAVAYIEVERMSEGVLWRLGVPILLLVTLASLAFWAHPDQRVPTTVTLLLALSAMYLVIFQSIPMIGKFTRFDIFVLSMFVLLFTCCALHQAVCTMIQSGKLDKWPMRRVYVRFLELCGRVIMLPFAVSLYIICFPKAVGVRSYAIAITTIVVFLVTVSLREFPALLKTVRGVMKDLGHRNNARKISKMERYFYNLYYHRKLTSEIKYDEDEHLHQRKHGESDDYVEKSNDETKSPPETTAAVMKRRTISGPSLDDSGIEFQHVNPMVATC